MESRHNSTQFGLKQEVIDRINAVFSKHSEVEEAIIYGSRAKDNYRNGSDIDISLKGDYLNLDIINSISLEIDDLLLPYAIDLSIFHQIDNKDLISHIERVGKIFYKQRD
jgi:predicted nucleotidyltransferase